MNKGRLIGWVPPFFYFGVGFPHSPPCTCFGFGLPWYWTNVISSSVSTMPPKQSASQAIWVFGLDCCKASNILSTRLLWESLLSWCWRAGMQLDRSLSLIFKLDEVIRNGLRDRNKTSWEPAPISPSITIGFPADNKFCEEYPLSLMLPY